MTAPRVPSVPVAKTAKWRQELLLIAEDLEFLLPADAAARRIRDITRDMARVEGEAHLPARRREAS